MNGKLNSFLDGKRVLCFDTSPIIYFIEESPSHLPLLQDIFSRIDRGAARGISSYLTLIEVMVKPLKNGARYLALQYKNILMGSARFQLFPLEEEIADEAARLRSRYDLRTPDAIQMATALRRNADVFITNDFKFKAVKEIDILMLNDYAGVAGPGESEMPRRFLHRLFEFFKSPR